MALYNVSPKQLKGQLESARRGGLLAACAAEGKAGLPPALLLAIASRETNCTDILGDGGHGRGYFQIDDGAHGEWLAKNAPNGIPPVRAAAGYAAGIVSSGLKAGRRLGLRAPAAPLRHGRVQRRRGRREAGAAAARRSRPRNDEPQLRRRRRDAVAHVRGLAGRDGHRRAGGGLAVAPAGRQGQAVVEMKARLRVVRRAPTRRAICGRARVRPLRRAGVEEFQRRNGLDADGKVGMSTWGALRGEKKTQAAPQRRSRQRPRRSASNILYPRPKTWNGLQPWIIPQVKAICERFGLEVTAGWSDDTAR